MKKSKMLIVLLFCVIKAVTTNNNVTIADTALELTTLPEADTEEVHSLKQNDKLEFEHYWDALPVQLQSLCEIGVYGGSVCNILAFAVLVFTPMRSSPVSVYLSFLCISDTVILWWDYSYFWSQHVTGDLPEFTRMCNVRMAVAITAIFISTWLVVVMTWERMAVVWGALKAKELQSRQRTFLISWVVVVFGICIFLRFYLGHTTTPFCLVNKGSKGRDTYIQNGLILSWIILANIIPDALLFLANCIIIYKVRKNTENSMMETSQGTLASDNELLRLVMTVSLTHVVLTLPYMVLFLNINLAGYFDYSDFGPSYTVAMDFCFVLAVYNHAINFFLYTASSQQFVTNIMPFFCCLALNCRQCGTTMMRLFCCVPKSALPNSPTPA